MNSRHPTPLITEINKSLEQKSLTPTGWKQIKCKCTCKYTKWQLVACVTCRHGHQGSHISSIKSHSCKQVVRGTRCNNRSLYSDYKWYWTNSIPVVDRRGDQARILLWMAQQQWPMTIPAHPLAELICITSNSQNLSQLSKFLKSYKTRLAYADWWYFSWKTLEIITTLRNKERK